MPARIVGDRDHAVSWIDFTYADGSQQFGISFFDFRDGLIQLITDFWPTPDELPESRRALVERY
ncbi:MAG: hypothetical protein ACREQM_05775 [Candidatus Dormibacteraceae bacterium]